MFTKYKKVFIATFALIVVVVISMFFFKICSMNDLARKAAVEKLIEIKGKKFLEENKGDFAISYSEVNDEYIITFLLSQSTGNVNQDKLFNKETPIQNFMTVSVNKKTNVCVVLEDKF